MCSWEGLHCARQNAIGAVIHAWRPGHWFLLRPIRHKTHRLTTALGLFMGLLCDVMGLLWAYYGSIMWRDGFIVGLLFDVSLGRSRYTNTFEVSRSQLNNVAVCNAKQIPPSLSNIDSCQCLRDIDSCQCLRGIFRYQIILVVVPGQFSMEDSWFPIQESWFSIKNPDFLLKNVDFIIKKQRWVP